MPLLSQKEQKAIYQTFLATKPERGKWIRLVRIPQANNFSTFVSFSVDAKFLALWCQMTLIQEDSRERVQFGSPKLPDVQEAVRAKGYRLIIVDAPTGLTQG